MFTVVAAFLTEAAGRFLAGIEVIELPSRTPGSHLVGREAICIHHLFLMLNATTSPCAWQKRGILLRTPLASRRTRGASPGRTRQRPIQSVFPRENRRLVWRWPSSVLDSSGCRSGPERGGHPRGESATGRVIRGRYTSPTLRDSAATPCTERGYARELVACSTRWR